MFFGGVTRRFPDLKIGFLECGVAWAVSLYHDIIEHWEKRNIRSLRRNLDPALVDVNVHPAKADVRFRDPGLVRGLIIGAIRQALEREGDRAATTGSSGMLAALRPQGGFAAPRREFDSMEGPVNWTRETSPHRPTQSEVPFGFAEPIQAVFADAEQPSARIGETPGITEAPSPSHPLGAPRAQVLEIVKIKQEDLNARDDEAACREEEMELLQSQAAEAKEALVGLAALEGDLLVLGAGGKMGPSLARMARRALDASGRSGEVVAVSRFGDGASRAPAPLARPGRALRPQGAARGRAQRPGYWGRQCRGPPHRHR